MLASASLGEDAALLDLLVEATQGAFERLVLTHSDFCQSRFTSPGQGSCVLRRARGQPALTLPDGSPVQGWRSIAEGPGSVKRSSSVAASMPVTTRDSASYDDAARSETALDTLLDLLDEAVAANGDKTALSLRLDDGSTTTWSYRELDRRSRRRAPGACARSGSSRATGC